MPFQAFYLVTGEIGLVC